MKYGELRHEDVVYIRLIETSDGKVVLSQYKNYDEGWLSEPEEEEDRTDYFCFFGTEMSVRATEVEVLEKIDLKVVRSLDEF